MSCRWVFVLRSFFFFFFLVIHPLFSFVSDFLFPQNTYEKSFRNQVFQETKEEMPGTDESDRKHLDTLSAK